MHLGAARNVLPFEYSLLLAYVDLWYINESGSTTRSGGPAGSASYDPHPVPSSGCATDE
jgi:hypothetical protein